jgi:hypothetical protein
MAVRRGDLLRFAPVRTNSGGARKRALVRGAEGGARQGRRSASDARVVLDAERRQRSHTAA